MSNACPNCWGLKPELGQTYGTTVKICKCPPVVKKSNQPTYVKFNIKLSPGPNYCAEESVFIPKADYDRLKRALKKCKEQRNAYIDKPCPAEEKKAATEFCDEELERIQNGK